MEVVAKANKDLVVSLEAEIVLTSIAATMTFVTALQETKV